MKACTLYSGSKGNATLILCDGAIFLVDIGVPYSALVLGMQKINLSPAQISAVFVTHSHIDHVCGAAPFAAKHPETPIFVQEKGAAEFFMRTFVAPKTFGKTPFECKNVTVTPYFCFHDAPACCGYKFTQNGEQTACVTDTGRIDSALCEFLSGCKTIIIESNHDPYMLETGPYPLMLKRRISGGSGHLSNAQTAELLRRICQSGIQNIVLAHLSEINNTPELAYNSAHSMLVRQALADKIRVYVALQHEVGELI